MSKTTDKPAGAERISRRKASAPTFYNRDSQAIEAVNAIEARKTEKRRTRTIVTRQAEPETETDDGSIRNSSGLTKADVDRFTKAAERRFGRPAYDDLRTLGAIYKKASDLALNESGQNSINNPNYKKAFSRIIAVLPPIADNAATAEKYRRHLLRIERAEPEFSAWYGEQQPKPRIGNPVDLWRAYKAFCDAGKQPSGNHTERNGSKHERELFEVKADAENKLRAKDSEIAGLKDQVRELGGEPADAPVSETLSINEQLQRIWDLQAAKLDNRRSDPTVVLALLLQRLFAIGFTRGAHMDAGLLRDIFSRSVDISMGEAEVAPILRGDIHAPDMADDADADDEADDDSDAA
jgi:hypothetical protein